jgi:hypothetical protein
VSFWLRVVCRLGRAGKLWAEGIPGLAGLIGVQSLAQEQGAVFRRHRIADAAMRVLRIVLVPERTGEDLRFQNAAEQLPIEEFVAEAAIVALVYAFLPRAARLDKADPDASLRRTLLQRLDHELPPVVAPRVPRGPVHPDRRLQRQDHLRGLQLPAGDDIAAVVAARVDNRQELNRRARGGHIEDQIHAPDVIEHIRPDIGLQPQRALGPPTLPGNPRSLLSPDALHRTPSVALALPIDQGVDPSVAIAQIAARERHKRRICTYPSLRKRPGPVLARGAGQPQIAVRLPSATQACRDYALGCVPLLKRAHHFFGVHFHQDLPVQYLVGRHPP